MLVLATMGRTFGPCQGREGLLIIATILQILHARHSEQLLMNTDFGNIPREDLQLLSQALIAGIEATTLYTRTDGLTGKSIMLKYM